MKKRIFGFLSMAAMALFAGEARADFLPGFSGWTMMSNSAPSDGLVNFRVYENLGGGNWATALGITPSALTGGGLIDTDAQYVYFYQVVNLNTHTNPVFGPEEVLTSFGVFSNAFTSGAYLAGTVFDDAAGAGGAVGPVGNRFLGGEVTITPGVGGGTPPDDALDGVPSLSSIPNAALFGFTASGAALAPVSMGIVGGPFGFAAFSWTPGPGISTGPGFSTVLILTSNQAPLYVPGLVDGPGILGGSDGDVPGAQIPPVPEPTSMALMGFGFVGLCGYGWRKRKQAD